MSKWFKLTLLAAGLAGAWFATRGDSEPVETGRTLRERLEREAQPEPEGGALGPEGPVSPEEVPSEA